MLTLCQRVTLLSGNSQPQILDFLQRQTKVEKTHLNVHIKSTKKFFLFKNKRNANKDDYSKKIEEKCFRCFFFIFLVGAFAERANFVKIFQAPFFLHFNFQAISIIFHFSNKNKTISFKNTKGFPTIFISAVRHSFFAENL